jgi:hypothetical protein
LTTHAQAEVTRRRSTFVPLPVLQVDNEPRVRDGYISPSTRGHAGALQTYPEGPLCRRNVIASAQPCPPVPPLNLHGKEGLNEWRESARASPTMSMPSAGPAAWSNSRAASSRTPAPQHHKMAQPDTSARADQPRRPLEPPQARRRRRTTSISSKLAAGMVRGFAFRRLHFAGPANSVAGYGVVDRLLERQAVANRGSGVEGRAGNLSDATFVAFTVEATGA